MNGTGDAGGTRGHSGRLAECRRARAVVLGAMLALLAAAKLAFAPMLGHQFADAGFYYQVARHVAEGDGLQTSVSLYNQGLRELPHPTNVYPLWPLVLGASARVLPLGAVAELLPEALYLAGLALLYLLANRIADGIRRGPAGGIELDAPLLRPGHAAVALLGLNHVHFGSTSLPYTEGLAFVLLFGALLAIGAGRPGGLAWPAAAGVLSALAYLTRFQLVGVTVAIPVVLLLENGPRRVPRAVVAVGAALLPVVFYTAWLASWMQVFTPAALVGFDAYRETPSLAPFQHRVPVEGLAYAMDRARGVLLAFDPTSRESYVRSFGPVAWVVPLALICAAVDALRHRNLRPAPRSGAGTTARAAILSGILILLPVHEAHVGFIWSWLFGYRHGLPLILLIIPAATWLVRGSRARRAAAAVLTGLSIAYGAARIGMLLSSPVPAGYSDAEHELAGWLDSLPAGASAITTRAQSLSVITRAGLHWTACREPASQTARFLDDIGVDHVIAYVGEANCPFLADVPRRLSVRRTFGAGEAAITVWGRP